MREEGGGRRGGQSSAYQAVALALERGGFDALVPHGLDLVERRLQPGLKRLELLPGLRNLVVLALEGGLKDRHLGVHRGAADGGAGLKSQFCRQDRPQPISAISSSGMLTTRSAMTALVETGEEKRGRLMGHDDVEVAAQPG